MGIDLLSDIGLICAVAGLALLALFGLPGEQETTPKGAGNGTTVAAPPRVLEQLVAVAGVALLVAAGFFQSTSLW
jgi:hypothetical protein